jgi:hypothetical protein
MSKDKGTKNTKKAPADRSNGKDKRVSDYKSEGKSKDPTLSAFIPKTEPRTPDSKKDK